MAAPIPPSREIPMEPPVVVLSDLHLGHPASFIRDPSQILPLLGPARTAIFNGDTFEQLHLVRRHAARRMLARLFELCADRGVRPFLLTGNHDPKASSAHYLDLFDGRVFLTHGDALHPAVAPWSREAPAVLIERMRLMKEGLLPTGIDQAHLLTKLTEMVAALYDHETPQGILGQSYMISKFLVQPWRIMIALNYWSRVVHYARLFVEEHRPSARLMIIGHTHRPGVWMSRNLTLVNTGSFQPLSRPLVVHFDDKKAVVHRTVHRANAWYLAEELHHRVIAD